MKITIDTKEDSEEEIEKVIRLLQEIKSGGSSSRIVDDKDPAPSSDEPGMFNMFANNDDGSGSKTEEEEKQEDNTPEITLY